MVRPWRAWVQQCVNTHTHCTGLTAPHPWSAAASAFATCTIASLCNARLLRHPHTRVLSKTVAHSSPPLAGLRTPWTGPLVVCVTAPGMSSLLCLRSARQLVMCQQSLSNCLAPHHLTRDHASCHGTVPVEFHALLASGPRPCTSSENDNYDLARWGASLKILVMIGAQISRDTIGP